MLYKFTVYWTKKMKRGLLEGMAIGQELKFVTEKDAKNYISFLLKQDDSYGIGIRLNHEED